ncbi:hypothetical protein LEP1GSC050_0716 [Leptospira broomii serovar Hurstbridge str. 5399]|uniref:Uncharacterized protein n=1 Tax=Leptospira broomii serovar Hurstbridge str. 5399 TaxID=1049789 RepID=T0FHY2_9LEPT|nr:hypothetical protein [Leptospira broomii]EQA47202.1 hypothetical protein LEP1GSC050_0716 [Leptospira broomii serovar Hurstbridge str. 5399]
MNRGLLIFGVWLLWLYSYRGYSTLGSFNSLEECKAAMKADIAGVLKWRTECKESK